MRSKQFVLKSADGSTIVDAKVTGIVDRTAVRAFFSRLKKSDVILPYEKENGKLSATLKNTEKAKVVENWLNGSEEGKYLTPPKDTTHLHGKKWIGAMYGAGSFGWIDMLVLHLKADADYVVYFLLSAAVGWAAVKAKDKLAFEGLDILKNAIAQKQDTAEIRKVL